MTGEAAGVRVLRLKRRSEFKEAAKGARWHGAAFVLQAAGRAEAARRDVVGVGFTVTRKLGKAVARNRIRRRLREAARRVLPDGARPATDYVLVARPAAQACAFQLLTADLARAMRTIGRQLGRASAGAGSR